MFLEVSSSNTDRHAVIGVWDALKDDEVDVPALEDLEEDLDIVADLAED